MKAPAHFDETSTKHFNFIVEQLQRIEKLDEAYLPIIDALAFNLTEVESCQKVLMKEGFIMDGLHGKKEHPAVSISKKAQSKVLESYKVLGLDASQRFKEDQAKPEDLNKDPLIQLLRAKF
ncbi:phage terminase, small subunit, putative, P27 family [Peribacillus simplex]|uniref:Phage terminase, small subunit, putative, P27 family n=1 Tax=Peribacillus simplex TaxID=1478 RepID=A0A9X8WLH0_9BACI|nr:P27 family phage terminase small subunit [Peribacillus simplex]SIR68591.1 phage terminase, small subunit, putative, P27 family [Peribacillus simplex]